MLLKGRNDIIAGLFLAVIALGALFWVIPFGIETSTGSGGMSPKFVPQVAAVVVLVLSLLLVVNGLLQTATATDKPETGNTFVYAVIWSVFCLVCWFGLSTLGFIVTSIAVIAVWGFWTGAREMLVLAALSVGVPIVISLGTRFVFSIYLP